MNVNVNVNVNGQVRFGVPRLVFLVGFEVMKKVLSYISATKKDE